MAPELDAVNLTRARKLFQRLLQADPENGDALNALEEVYRRQGENQKLALVLEKRAEGSYDGDTRRDALLSAARAHQETGNPDAAIASLETLRTSGEADDEALDLLMGLLSARGKTAELVEVLEERAHDAMDAEKRATLFLSLAEEVVRFGRHRGAGTPGKLWTRRRTARFARAPGSLVAVEEARGDFGALKRPCCGNSRKPRECRAKTAVLFNGELSQDRQKTKIAPSTTSTKPWTSNLTTGRR